MVKYVNYGNSKCGVPMYVITMFRTPLGSYKVEVSPCDIFGTAVSDPMVWDMFPNWWSARKYVHKQYKKFNRYVNERR